MARVASDRPSLVAILFTGARLCEGRPPSTTQIQSRGVAPSLSGMRPGMSLRPEHVP